jgi:hypothetical protein
VKYSMVTTVNWADDTSKEIKSRFKDDVSLRRGIKMFMRNVPDASSFTFIVVCDTQGDKDV